MKLVRHDITRALGLSGVLMSVTFILSIIFSM